MAGTPDVGVEEDTWKTLSLTHVEYQVGDHLAKLFAIYSLLPLVIVVVFITAFIIRRDLHTLTYGIGVIINYMANYTLKQYLREPRPLARAVQFEEFGMPSSHSQYMWFVSTYMALFTVFRLHHKPACLEMLWKLVLVSVSLAGAWLMAYSRVYLQYHTTSQVVWGGVAGGAGALLWFLLTQIVFTPLYPWVASWRISEFFLIRDTTTIPNICWFEYVKIRGEVNQRTRASQRKNQ